MRNILNLLFLLGTTIVFGQLPEILVEPNTNTDKFDNHIGSIYKNKKPKDASVTDEKSGTFNAKLKYNIHLDILECQKDNTSYKLVKSPTIHANIDGEYYYYCDFKNQRGLNRKGYYVLVELNDNYRIYKKHTTAITSPDETDVDPFTGKAPRGRIKVTTTYYLEENSIIKELPTSKKDLVIAFGDEEEQLKEYIKKEKINPKNEEDMVRFVSKYNALKNLGTSPSRSLLSNRVQKK